MKINGYVLPTKDKETLELLLKDEKKYLEELRNSSKPNIQEEFYYSKLLIEIIEEKLKNIRSDKNGN